MEGQATEGPWRAGGAYTSSGQVTVPPWACFFSQRKKGLVRMVPWVSPGLKFWAPGD